MNLASIRHRSTEDHIFPIGRHTLAISLSAAREDLKAVTLVWWPRYETDKYRRHSAAVPISLRDRYLDHYRTVIRTEEISAYTRYYFLLEGCSGEKLYFGPHGFQTEDIDGNFFEFLWPNPTDSFRAPSWAQEQIYYQIFPERFCNGNPAISPAAASPWGTPPNRENFMGGDLRGITEKLDYIADLGVTCLYLTPVFTAPSNHKYDTVDYYQIDPTFGTAEDLKQLIDGVHRRGMRILLDGVFNHCGYYWPPFQDLVKNGETSVYRNWFFPQSFPVGEAYENYDCVGHYKWMPKINLADPGARDYFIAVGRYWIEEFGIDGWRLDVADEVPTVFWEEFSSAVKAVRPDALLLGETWGDADRLISFNRLDTAMNYIFRDIVVDWLAEKRILPSELDHRLNQMLSLYPEEVGLRLYNPLDSHDTARFRYLCENKRMHELAVVLQMTAPGCPAVFYGDEIGLEGDNDPGCRLCMEWEEVKQNRSLSALYQELISLRKASPSLIAGDFHCLLCSDSANVYGFTRSTSGEETAVLINAGAESFRTKIKADGNVVFSIGSNRYSPEKDGGCIVLPPYSAEIIQKKER